MNCLSIFIWFLFFVFIFHSEALALKIPNHYYEDMDQTIDFKKEKFGAPINFRDYKRARLLPEERHQKHDAFEYLKKNNGNFEMDIKLDPNWNRNAIRNLNNRWPNRRVPYVISDEFDQNARALIANVFDEYHRKTCIRFVGREDSDQNYIKIVSGNGCSSYVGVISGPQEVTLGPGCVHASVIRHELMHALGFQHEQTRTDRDNYVAIKWENILPQYRFNFNKEQQNSIQLLGVPYDYRSIMHYGKGTFSNNGQNTIEPQTQTELGGNDLTRIDVKKINKLYGCKRRG